jgi:hypothetical protein
MLHRHGASPPAGWCSSARSPSCGAGTRGSPANHRPPPPAIARELRVRFMLPLPFAAAAQSAALTGFCGYTSGIVAPEALQAYAAARPCCGNISFFPHSFLPGCRHMPHLLTCSSRPLQLQHSSGRCHRGNGGHILWAPSHLAGRLASQRGVRSLDTLGKLLPERVAPTGTTCTMGVRQKSRAGGGGGAGSVCVSAASPARVRLKGHRNARARHARESEALPPRSSHRWIRSRSPSRCACLGASADSKPHERCRTNKIVKAPRIGVRGEVVWRQLVRSQFSAALRRCTAGSQLHATLDAAARYRWRCSQDGGPAHRSCA